MSLVQSEQALQQHSAGRFALHVVELEAVLALPRRTSVEQSGAPMPISATIGPLVVR